MTPRCRVRDGHGTTGHGRRRGRAGCIMGIMVPVRIEIRKSARCLRFVFADGEARVVGFDALRAASPAADAGERTPSPDVAVLAADLVGNYALRPRFSDGHESGIYDWPLLRRLSRPE